MQVPKEVMEIVRKLTQAGFEAYLVGGCVRDILLNKKPTDWDVTTNARPEEIQQIFPDSTYENKFGTVRVKTNSKDPTLKVVEVTTFRLEGRYTDRRHPDVIKFADNLKDDLVRRDFTVNAMAVKVFPKSEFKTPNIQIIDLFNGQDDLKKRLIRAVGDPQKRFEEDALRLIRAVRLSCQLEFEIERNTYQAIAKQAKLISIIAKERIRDELIKIINTKLAARGINQLHKLGLLKFIIPELEEGIKVGPAKHHIYNVYEHSIRSLDYAAKKGFSLEVRLAALFHDIAKPRCKRGTGKTATFYGHEVVGARMTREILTRLHFPKKIIDKVAHLVRYHLFYYNVGEVTEAGVRRFLRRVGPENVDDLIKLRQADRIGSGVPKAVPYRIRHLLYMIEKVKHHPISVKMLKIDGNQVMKIAKIPPGPKVGWILTILLDRVLEDPSRNCRKVLESEVKNLMKLSDAKLKQMANQAKKRKMEFEKGIEIGMKRKYYVR